MAKEREMQVALDKKEKENKLEIKKLKEKHENITPWVLTAGGILGVLETSFILFALVKDGKFCSKFCSTI